MRGDPAAYPLEKGTRWTYVTREGTEKTSRVEGITKVRVGERIIDAAILRRTSGIPHIVVRTDRHWIECGPLPEGADGFDCQRPLVFFSWPLSIGSKWSGRDLDFVVRSRESVAVPAGNYENAWKVSYGPPGGEDPLGEVWIVEGVGPVRILERESDYRLVKFERGGGASLSVAPEEVEKAILGELNTSRKGSSRSRFLLGVGRDGAIVLLLFGSLALLAAALVVSLAKREENLAPPLDPHPQGVSALLRAGILTEARMNLEELIRQHPGYADLHYQRATIRKAEGDLSGARESLAEALALNPDYVEALLEMGRLLMTAGKSALAAEHFRRALRIHPDYADIAMELGRALTALGNEEEARQLLSKCRKSAQIASIPSSGEKKS